MARRRRLPLALFLAASAARAGAASRHAGNATLVTTACSRSPRSASDTAGAHAGGLCPAPRRSALGARIDRAQVPWFNIIVSKKRKVAVTGIAKAMISSVRAIANREAAASGCKASRCAEARMNRSLQSEIEISAYTRAVMLRDPFERLASAYFDSADNPYIAVGACPSSRACSLDKFVSELWHNWESARRNEHFTPQAEHARMGAMRYHYVLRMSSAADIACLLEGLLGGSRDTHANQSPGGGGSGGSARDRRDKLRALAGNFTPRAVERAARLYERDVALWRATEPACDSRRAHGPSLADMLAPASGGTSWRWRARGHGGHSGLGGRVR